MARTGSSTKESGTAFVTFSNNNTFAGYGVTTLTFSVFTLSGTWNVDASGRLVGNYTENLNGTFINGSVVGKATTGKKLQLSTVASNGKFKLNGKPAAGVPDLSGSWLGQVTEAKTTVGEAYQIAASNEFPGVFDITGNGSGPNGPFTISGAAILTAKGQVTAYTFSSFQAGGSTYGYVTGNYNASKQTASLSGRDISGLTLRAKLFRP